MTKPDKTNDLYLKVPQADGSLNHYETGNVMQPPPTIGIRATEIVKNTFAKAELNSWVNFTGRPPREGRSR